MIKTINDWLERLFRPLLAILFASLITVVFLQVLARNVLKVPMSWTSDLAQLLFSWCIFVGAALAFRAGGHYLLNLWPEGGLIGMIPKVASTVGSAIVIFVLVWFGAAMSHIGLNRLTLTLNISEFWYFLPIPIGGVLMALFLIEQLTESRTR